MRRTFYGYGAGTEMRMVSTEMRVSVAQDVYWKTRVDVVFHACKAAVKYSV